MPIPEHIKKLIDREIERNKALCEITLDRRKSRTEGVESYHALNEEDKRATELLEAWNGFHSKLPYSSFREFYCKSELCSQLKPKHVSEELFVQLIADRDFLFLEYNEHFNDPKYPLLRSIVEAPASKMYHDSREAEKVLAQGFVPTKSHYDAFEKWQENISTLQEALERRRTYLNRRKLGCSTGSEPGHEGISIPIRKSETVTDMDERLALLFQAYLKALSEYAHTENYDKDLERKERNTRANMIHSVVHYLDEHPEISKDRQALILFQFFNGCMKKLAEGRLRKYNFLPPQKRGERGVSPSKTQKIVSQKIRCNIVLYDYLLKLFPPEDLGYAKFQFYAFSGYDWYTHYELPDEIDWSRITFNLPADLSDGVDELGHLLRQNIYSCMPNSFGWLAPDLPNTQDVDAQGLATLLMHDAALPTKSQLIPLIKAFIKSEEGKEAVSEYRKDQFSQYKTREHLENWCMSKDLAFRDEEFLIGEKRPALKRNLRYSRYVLERMLKEILYQEARNNLSEIALKLFGDLFVFNGNLANIFDFTGIKYM